MIFTKYRRILLTLLCVTAVLAFAGCQKKDVSEENPDAPVIAPTEDKTDENGGTDDKTPDDAKPDDVPEEPKFYNKLTGLETTEELSNIRPVGIMINNIKQATPQQGISQADVIYEVLAEGGISRLFCLFTDYASLPETGSIRSSRDYYIDLANAHDAIYVHCGGSPAAYDTLKARGTENMDGIYFSTPFYRNEWRKKHMGMEHSMMTTGERLVKGIEEKGYRTTSDFKQPFSFKESVSAISGENVTDAKTVAVEFSYYAKSTFDYDEATGTYLKGQFSAPHIDSNNNAQLAFENVILLYASQGAVKNDEKGRIHVDFIGTGDGIYITNGKTEPIKWSKESRTSSYTLYKADGVTELLLNPGKTYVGIPPLGAKTEIQ